MKADWISLREALDRVMSAVRTTEGERIELLESRGRVLAEDVVAPIDLPRWTNSAMDGFAVRAADIAGATRESPITLPVVDDIAAGSFPRAPLRPGTAARVMTGAAVPEGADSVVRVEHTDGTDGNRNAAPARVSVFDDHDAFRNLRMKGEEVAAGGTVLRRGTLLRAGTAGVAAAVGRADLLVHRRPSVALLTSGDELVHVEDFDSVAEGRKIVSSNSYSLRVALEEAGCEVRYLGIARDTPDSVREAILRAEGCDALVTSGGISVGAHDHVRNVLMELETRVSFWRVRMKPGSPFAFGTIGSLGGIPWFGLPGNPVSSMVTFEVFARPALARMGGRANVHRRTVDARLMDSHEGATGLTNLLRVRLERTADGTFGARLTGRQGSGMLSSVAMADGLLVIPEGHAGDAIGGTFRVLLMEAAFEAPEPAF